MLPLFEMELAHTTPYVTDLDNGETETQVEKAIIDSPAYSSNPPESSAGSVGRALYPMVAGPFARKRLLSRLLS